MVSLGAETSLGSSQGKLLLAAVGNSIAGDPLLERIYLPESFSLCVFR
jgi:hypothetical protein